MLIALLAVLGVDLIVIVTAGGATVEAAAKAEDIELLLGPYRKPADATAGSKGV